MRPAAIMSSTLHPCAGASPRPRSWRPAVVIPSSRMRAARISYGTEAGGCAAGHPMDEGAIPALRVAVPAHRKADHAEPRHLLKEQAQ